MESKIDCTEDFNCECISCVEMVSRIAKASKKRTVNEAVDELKLDRRTRYFSFCGTLTYIEKHKISGRNLSVPVAVISDGFPVEVTDNDFTFYSK